MPRPNPESLHPIDDLLTDIKDAVAEQDDLGSIDDLLADIDGAVGAREREIAGWTIEKMRKEAVDSRDEHVLKLLSEDSNFIVRTLVAVNTHIPEAILRKIVENGNDYQRMVAANNPSASPELLDRIADLSNNEEVVAAVRKHPNLSRVTKFKLENHS